MEENQSTFKLSGREKAGLIWHYLRPCWGHFAAALLCACLSMALNALTPQIIRITVDSILGSEEAKLPALVLRVLPLETLRQEPVTALWWAAGAVMVTALLRGLCSFGQRAQLSRGSEAYVKGLRDDLYRRIQYLPFAWHKQHPTGDIIQRCTSDVDVIRTFVCNQLVEVVRTVFLIILYLWIMFRMNVKLSLIALAFIPIVGLSSGVFYRKISSRFKTADEAEGEVTTCAQENLTGVRVVRAFGRERYEKDKFQDKNERYAGLWIHLGKLLSVYWASGTLLTCLQVMVIILAGIHESVAGAMTLGAFVAFVSYNESLAWPVRSLGRVLSDMSKAGVSMDRVGYILRSPEEQDQPDDVPLPGGDIVFDHVTLRLRGAARPEGRVLHHPGGRAPSPCWAAPVPARARWCICWTGCTTCRRAPAASPSAAWTCGISGAATCGGTSALCCRSPSCSPRPFERTSRPRAPMRRRMPCAVRRPSPAWTIGDLLPGGV